MSILAKQEFANPYNGVQDFKMFINNEWVDSVSEEKLETVNPFSGKSWATAPAGNKEDINLAVQAAKDAFEKGPWSTFSGSQRGKLLRKLGDLIAENAEELAISEVLDNGKLIRDMLGQMKAVPEWCYYYAGYADKINGESIPVDIPNMISYTVREPLGVVGAIIPWNAPILLTLYKLCPALAAGNTIVIKPSEYTPISALKLAELVEKAGFPPGVVNIVTGFGNTAGAALSEHKDVRKITFTGSTQTGRIIGKTAMDQFKKVSLELGGKSPNIIFEDADLDNAVNGVLQGIFAATGQTCMAGSRVLIQESIYEEVVEALIEKTKRIKLGNPLDMETEMGTIAFPGQLEKVEQYIEIAKNEGATLLYGGAKPTEPELQNGLFIEPTIFGDVKNSMRIAQEEVFGPVVCLIKFKDEEQAVELANDVDYGLAAGVWTKDIQRGLRMTKAIKAGTVWVNNYRKVSPAVPFGGFKSSGLGRENAWEAILEYTQVKSVMLDTGSVITDPFRIL